MPVSSISNFEERIKSIQSIHPSTSKWEEIPRSLLHQRDSQGENKTKCPVICSSRQPALATAWLQLLLQIRSHNSPQYGPSTSPRNRTPVGEVVAMCANDSPLKLKAANIISNSSRLFLAAIQPMPPDSETGIICPNRQSVTKSFVICFVGWERRRVM